MNIMRASNQWANRPADERYESLQAMFAAAQAVKAAGVEKPFAINRLKAVVEGGELLLEGCNAAGQTKRSSMTHFSFGQLARFVVPEDSASPNVEHLRRLPAHLAAEVINHDLTRCDRMTKALYHSDVNDIKAGLLPVARAFNTPKYGRFWNADAIADLLPLQAKGWRVPPARPAFNDPRARPATEADCLKNRMEGLGINVGDMIAPAGLYMGEKDMFAFMVNEDRPINGGGKTPLYRGFFLENSEVGSLSFWITTFLYNTVCGNHIVWGASNVKEIRVVHIGNNVKGRAASGMEVQLKEYANESVSEIEGKIKVARTFTFGATKDEVVKFLYDKRISTQSILESAFDEAEKHPEDGGDCDPKSAWGMAQGMTRLSQGSPFMDKRVEMDKAAGSILELATGKGKNRVKEIVLA